MKNINSLNITNQILNKYNLRANKRFGQNFLIDDNVLENIVEVSEITEDDLVIEIHLKMKNFQPKIRIITKADSNFLLSMFFHFLILNSKKITKIVI